MISRFGLALGACVAVSVAGATWLLPHGRETLQTPFAEPRREARWDVDDSRAAAVRELALRQARVWAPPPDPSAADLTANPRDPDGNLSGDLVRCLYLDRPPRGTTPKFDCVLSNGEIIRVKYGSTTEIQGEVAASRFITALGFGADRMYLVRHLRCFGCLRTPYQAARLLDRLNLREAAQSLLPDNRYSDFEWAAVERHFEGREIVSPDRPGWGWEELAPIDGSYGANRAERDALRLVSLMIAHSDAKPSNQRLVCVGDRDASDTCPRPFALIHDLGDTFGLNNSGLAQWKKFGIWKDRERCAVTMREFPDDRITFRDRYISEEGRRLLARELRMLTDAQIEALFVSTRVTRVSGNGNAELWTQTMRDKIHEIVDGPPCPATADFETSPAVPISERLKGG
jgi:hypothetical protein